MDQARTGGEAGIDSTSLLAAYHLLLETVVESGDDDELLQRALAVVAAIRWPWTHRYFAACVAVADPPSLRLAAYVADPASAPPKHDTVDTTACLCALALVRPERLIFIDTSAEPDGRRCACAVPGTHLVLPLSARGRVLGVLHIALGPGRRPGETEQSFLVLVATLLGAELGRRRSEQEHDRLEMQFLQAQKMEAVGRLAGGVAHDFNNILTAITSYADLGLLKLPGDNPLRRNFEEILVAADRAALLTQQLLAFSHRQPLAPRVIDAGELLAGLGKPLRRLLGADVELTVRGEPGGTRILADPSLIEQLVINLALSARDALPGGGRVKFETMDVLVDAAFALAHPSVTPGPHLCLLLGVAGPGLLPGELRALCGGDAETPEPHPGMTLGPAAVQDIVRQCGGSAHLDAIGEDELALRICFPAARRDVAAIIGPQGANHLPRGTETILLAEDDDSVRVVVAEVLRDLGYQVLEARDGREAQDLAEKHVGPIDALVADMVMPGFGAVELSRRLSATRPALRSLFVSGTAGNTAAAQDLGEPGDVILSKPFSPWALASRLRQALDAPRGAPGPASPGAAAHPGAE